MSVCTSYCNKCCYRKRFASGLLNYCDYLCMTGKQRPCPAGDGCTARVTQRVYRKRQLTPEEVAARLERKRALEREKKKRYYARNREKILAKNKERRQANQEHLREYQKEYREKKKEE